MNEILAFFIEARHVSSRSLIADLEWMMQTRLPRPKKCISSPRLFVASLPCTYLVGEQKTDRIGASIIKDENRILSEAQSIKTAARRRQKNEGNKLSDCPHYAFCS